MSDTEIVVEDPDAPAEDSPAVTSTRTVDLVVSVLLLGLALLLGYDNWKTGMSWEASGPQAGYFPFYLCVILAGAALFGFFKEAFFVKESGAFVTRDQLWRVVQVFGPTFAFCLATQWLGIYVASFLLVAGFMRYIGKITWWKSLLTSFIFAMAMFITFDVAFDVIMPKGPLEAAFGH